MSKDCDYEAVYEAIERSTRKSLNTESPQGLGGPKSPVEESIGKKGIPTIPLKTSLANKMMDGDVLWFLPHFCLTAQLIAQMFNRSLTFSVYFSFCRAARGSWEDYF